MAKKKANVVYKCSNCGFTQPRWLGRCPECGEWNTLEEHTEDAGASSLPYGRIPDSSERITPVPLSSVDPMECERISTGNTEFDRVLGGGATKRSAILIGGEPGIGKSTLLLQTASSVQSGGRVLYISGEEYNITVTLYPE